ncbi:hypothetical protein ACTXT7_006935 [Hymenolepis weldensis]
MSHLRCLGVMINICLGIYVQTRKHTAGPPVDTIILSISEIKNVEFTKLTRLIEPRALEQTGKCGYVTGRIENKRGVRTETSSANQRSRSP